MKGLLFKRKRNSFIRSVNELIQIIEIQKYSFLIDEKEVFTINIGLINLSVFDKVFLKMPSINYCEGIINFNVGELLNNFDGRTINKYWIVENQKKLFEQIQTIIVNNIVGFFDQIENNSDIIDFLEKNNIVSKNTPAIKMQLEEIRKITS